MDPLFIIELGIVGIIVMLQFVVFSRNNIAINSLYDLFPDMSSLKINRVALETDAETVPVVAQEVDLVDEKGNFSPTFRQILSNTNAYLSRNHGEVDFELMKDITDAKVESQENAIEANLNLPLYIGLLCTFTGIIIGLVKISIDGVSDDAIQSFIGGVLIGMVGSAVGLALTVRSTYRLKEARKVRDRDQYGYFSFLRTEILPARRKRADMPLDGLRDNLSAFNESFAQYQGNINSSLGESLRLFQELKDAFQQIRAVEQGLQGMGKFVQANDGLIEKQVEYLESYARKAETFSRKLQTHFQDVDKQVETLVSENIKALDRSTQAAYVKMDQYLASMQHGDSRAFAEALNRDLDKIRGDVATLQEKSLEVNAKLLSQLHKEEDHSVALAQEVRGLRKELAQSVERSGAFTHTLEWKMFTYAGTLAFMLGIAGGAIYLFNFFTA
ncbi:MAG: hypothetical protein AAFR61_19005 [Bacteroidota bacterium]